MLDSRFRIQFMRIHPTHECKSFAENLRKFIGVGGTHSAANICFPCQQRKVKVPLLINSALACRHVSEKEFNVCLIGANFSNY
ncbi:hypothetical protein NPIL_12051 [Nephila pilipes]|uniref:Uncharacterized protein n=1 Tax=Nephila pilipes TaxID=299642 RepID=A0A8X6UU07_NEPPI|nr:hypothetical protein NPIL_12051 [Nephila pilipes]